MHKALESLFGAVREVREKGENEPRKGLAAEHPGQGCASPPRPAPVPPPWPRNCRLALGAALSPASRERGGSFAGGGGGDGRVPGPPRHRGKGGRRS